MTHLDQARHLLALNEDQLLTLLAQGSADYVGKAQADYSAREFGQRLYNMVQDKFVTSICPLYCEQRHNWIAEDGAEAVVVIAGWIEEKLIGFPAFTLAAIIVKRGLRTLCTCP